MRRPIGQTFDRVLTEIGQRLDFLSNLCPTNSRRGVPKYERRPDFCSAKRMMDEILRIGRSPSLSSGPSPSYCFFASFALCKNGEEAERRRRKR